MKSEDNHLLETIRSVLVPIHPAGYLFIAIFAVAALILSLVWSVLGWLGLIATAWCIYFFRDPARVTPLREGLIISPADGVVQKIVTCVPPAELELGADERTRISIFMNVFNVHVNRSPVDGSVTRLHYQPGKFVNASLDKASEENERQSIRITTADNRQIGVVQIAGLVARRILCDLKDGQSLKAGERFGIIRFGSRVDVYLPQGVNPSVLVGQVAVGGETIIADMQSANAQPLGNRQ
jgi:phosphatidylserine decarboxylase